MAQRTFTLAELATFDGKNGRPAYVAVDGVVYDVSASAMWPQGEHTSCNLGARAGQDLSDEIAKAPARMRSQLSKFPVIGTLTQP
jgi:predicted heme/steroid binding protein